MTTSQTPFHPDIFVRRRVLFASLTVAVIVAVIFITVAYKLATDIGKNLEKNLLDGYFNQLVINRTTNPSSQHTSSQKQSEANPLLFGFYELHQGTVTNHKANALVLSATELEALLQSLDEDSYVEYHNNVTYVTQSNIDGVNVVALWRSKTLERILDSASSTLTFTAFITLLITLWSSILVSALISKRVAKRNEELEQLAMHDPLTSLKNKTCLQVSFKQYIETKIEQGQSIPHGSLLYVDLDRFKEINDTLGHETADALLTMVAERLGKVVGDKGETFRLRSDEFAIWIAEEPMDVARECAFEVLYSCRKPVKIGGQALEIGASVGLVCYPNQGTDIDSLLRCADTAMLHAKKQRLGVQEYDASLADITKLSVTLRGQLHAAMQREEFQLYYQPKVDLKTQQVIGVEAVTRWHHPTEGEIAPSVFIELVEQSGIVHAFTRYILAAAIKQINHWYLNGISVPIAMNLSPYNMLDKAFIPFIKQMLDAHHCPPQLLEFELTESATMIDIAATKQFMAELNALGVKTSIDDFGTGMSSFAYIKDLNIDSVKIDKSFVTNVVNERKDCKIVEAIISLCKTLSIRVIAEGIETEQQAQLLADLGCDIGQGYYFGRPQLASDLRLNNTEN